MTTSSYTFTDRQASALEMLTGDERARLEAIYRAENERSLPAPAKVEAAILMMVGASASLDGLRRALALPADLFDGAVGSLVARGLMAVDRDGTIARVG